MVYIREVYTNRSKKSWAVSAAEANLQNALIFFNKGDSDELSLDLYTIGRGYESLGDLSDENKCRYYEEARQMFVRQLPLIKGDSYTAYGATTPLEPVRAEVRKHLDEVNDKRSQARC